MYNLQRRKTLVNDQVANDSDVNIPLNLHQIFVEITNQVMTHQRILSELNRHAIEYQQWIFDEQQKAEQILRESKYLVPGTRIQINLWSNDFLNLLQMNGKERNDENDKCYAIHNLIKEKMQPQSNSLRYYQMNSLSCNNDYNDQTIRSNINVAKCVSNFCAKRTANAICRKRKVVELVAERTRKFREESHRRVKQRKNELEKGDEEKRNESLSRIRLWASKATANRERKRYELSGTLIAKCSRNIHGLTSNAKQLHRKAAAVDRRVPAHIIKQSRERPKMTKNRTEELFSNNDNYDAVNYSAIRLKTDASQIASAKSVYSETTKISQIETAASEASNIEAAFLLNFNYSDSKMNNEPSVILTEIFHSPKHTKREHTGIELVNVSKSNVTPKFLSPESSSKQNDVNNDNAHNSFSISLTSVNTASILERTRPDRKSIDAVQQQSTYVTEINEIDNNDKLHQDMMKNSSTYIIHSLRQSEQNNPDDDIRLMSMDLKSSSCQTKSMTTDADGDIVKEIIEKGGKVTSGGIALDATKRKENTRKFHCSTQTNYEKNDGLTAYDNFDQSFSDLSDLKDISRKKIPSWAEDENLRQILVKICSLNDTDALFGKIHPPDMQKMFGNNTRSVIRSSSAIWESPIWNPRVGYSAYQFNFGKNEKHDCKNVRRSQRVKKPVSYISYF